MSRLTTAGTTLIIGAAVIGAIVAAWYFSSSVMKKSDVDNALPADVELKLQNVKFTNTEHGSPLWTLTAAWAAKEVAGGVTRARDVKVVFYGKHDTQTVLTADHGEIMPDHNQITVHGNVRLVRDDGTVLLTDYLEYQRGTDEVTTDSTVHFSTDNMHVKGRGMHLDIDSSKVLIFHNVEAVIEEG